MNVKKLKDSTGAQTDKISGILSVFPRATERSFK